MESRIEEIIAKEMKGYSKERRELCRKTILDYLNESPIESFREPMECGYAKYNCCSGSYYISSGHSNCGGLYRNHLKNIKVSESLESIMPIFNTRFHLGYGLNDIGDFLGLRRNLAHISGTPGELADIKTNGCPLSWGYPSDNIIKYGDKNLIEEISKVSAILTPLHQAMSKKWSEIYNIDPDELMKRMRLSKSYKEWNSSNAESLDFYGKIEEGKDNLRRLLINDFGEKLRYAEKKLSQGFQNVTGLMKDYATKIGR